jgi:putative sterol carrier protein
VKVESGAVKYWFINTRDPDLPAVELIDADMVEARQPHAVLKCEEKTLIALAEGNKSPEMAYMTGALKITGNINSAMKLKRILEMARKAILG